MNRKAYLETIDQVIANGHYKDNWDSLSGYQIPEWYQKAKFGLFIHWGIYSVPAFSSEWYSRNMYIQDSPEYKHHIETYGPHDQFGYKDFIPMFKAEKFDPEAWASLFNEAGIRYICPVAEHHDGFQMYDSELSCWNAAQMGPKRNVLGELHESAAKYGITPAASSHRAEHWFFMGHGRHYASDVKEPMDVNDFYWPAMPEGELHDIHSMPYPDQEYLEDWLLRCCEIVDRYQPRLFYFDWWIEHEAFKPYLKKFAAYYYNRAIEWGEEVVINYKHDAFQFGCAVVDVERGQFAEAKPYYWQTDTAVARNSWCYTRGNVYKPTAEIICDLVDIVSKNGNMMLNIGPKADGSIPEEDQKILREIGQWLKVNGEAIYGSRVWRMYGEGPTKISEGQFTDSQAKTFTGEDIRFTVAGSYLYATVLNYPEDQTVRIRALAENDASHLPLFHGIIRDVDVLGFEEKPLFERNGERLKITTHNIHSELPVVFKIKID